MSCPYPNPYLPLSYPILPYLPSSELKQALQALDAQVHCILGPGPATLYRDIAAYLLDAPALRAELEGYADALTPTADCQVNPGRCNAREYPPSNTWEHSFLTLSTPLILGHVTHSHLIQSTINPNINI